MKESIEKTLKEGIKRLDNSELKSLLKFILDLDKINTYLLPNDEGIVKLQEIISDNQSAVLNYISSIAMLFKIDLTMSDDMLVEIVKTSLEVSKPNKVIDKTLTEYVKPIISNDDPIYKYIIIMKLFSVTIVKAIKKEENEQSKI